MYLVPSIDCSDKLQRAEGITGERERFLQVGEAGKVHTWILLLMRITIIKATSRDRMDKDGIKDSLFPLITSCRHGIWLLCYTMQLVSKTNFPGSGFPVPQADGNVRLDRHQEQ